MKGPKYQKERLAHPIPVSITINTRVPSKWRFQDLETGDVWKWEGYVKGFRRAE